MVYFVLRSGGRSHCLDPNIGSGNCALYSIGINDNDRIRLYMVGKDRGHGRAAVDHLCFRKEFLGSRVRTILATVERWWSQVILWYCYQRFNY